MNLFNTEKTCILCVLSSRHRLKTKPSDQTWHDADSWHREAVLVTTLLPCGVTPQGSCATSYHTPGMWGDTTGKLY